MSDVERLAEHLRKLADDADGVIESIRVVARRAVALEQTVSGLHTSGANLRRLSEVLRLAVKETTAAVSAMDDLRAEGARFANSLATGEPSSRGSMVRDAIGDALIAAEAAHLFLTPSLAPPVPTPPPDQPGQVVAQLVELSSEQLRSTDDLNDLKEAFDTPHRVVEARRIRNRED
ncbi:MULTISPECIES: hypothetical protein [Mycolicibacterium]|uniref:hypothetical protein n=1 Tax=Mycolicibacterium TaxID=1866885 RepID=UPI00006E9B33|nr:hypothetical protein [Mycolicibacterium vanbaalenii]MCV7130318.1 hypothetical protein [Mycolicibacterium vanbaalenii PYR-1]